MNPFGSLHLGFSDLNLGDLPAATAAPKADLPNIKKRPKKTRLGIRTEAGQDTGKHITLNSAKTLGICTESSVFLMLTCSEC